VPASPARPRGLAASLKLAVFPAPPFHVLFESRPGAPVLPRRLARRRRQSARRPEPALHVILIAVIVAFVKSGPLPLADKTALVLRIDGTIGEQKSGNLRSTALDQVRGEAVQKVQLRDILNALDAAAEDPKISSLVVVLDEMRPTGFSTLREIAAAIDRFKASGKKVVAWGSGYDQRQYYVAAHADEVYLHPLGMVYIAGFGSLRNYYKDALDKLGVTVNVVRVGTFKSAVEPFIANEPSAPALEADKAPLRRPLEDVRRRGREGEEAPAGSIMRGIDEAPQRLAAVGGDAAKFALAEKLVDALKTRDELRALMIARGAKDDDENTFRQISFDDYLGHVRPRVTGDAIGVVVAEGEIVDGQAPAGTIGGLSTANLIKKARDNKDVKALVLRVDSPGGSVFGSELVRRELEVTRAAGKPVVVSMGNTAASGGYWISTASDEIVADAATITGSIGVFALLPTADQTLAKLGVHPAGVATTWLRNADDPRLPLDPRLADLIQKSVDHTYLEFTTKVARARKTTPTRSTRSRRGACGRGAGQGARPGRHDRPVRRRGPLGGDARQARRQAAHRLHRARSGQVRAAREHAQRQVASLVGAEIDARIGAAVGVAPQLVRGAARDLGWVAEIAERRKPFAAVVHCLCGDAN
jgi:protease-4